MGMICKITNRLHPRVCQILLGKSCALPTYKKICQVKKRVHLQQSDIISLAKSRSNLHQESWEKQVDLPNCRDNHKLCKWVGKSYKNLYCTEIITKACLLRCKITHTQITIIIDTSEQGYSAVISSWRDMQNHTHTLILLAGRRSCCTWSSNKLHLCWWLKQWSLDTGWNCSS
jgi:hypothetical protein